MLASHNLQLDKFVYLLPQRKLEINHKSTESNFNKWRSLITKSLLRLLINIRVKRPARKSNSRVQLDFMLVDLFHFVVPVFWKQEE